MRFLPATPLIMPLSLRTSLRLCASARATYFPTFALPARSAFNNILCFPLSLRLCAFARATYFPALALPARSAPNNVLFFCVPLSASAPLRETSLPAIKICCTYFIYLFMDVPQEKSTSLNHKYSLNIRRLWAFCAQRLY